MRAITGKRFDVADQLLQKGADANVVDNGGLSAQHVAAFDGKPDASWWLYCKGSWKNRFQVADPPKEEPKAGEEAINFR
jgi:hypothetical protein